LPVAICGDTAPQKKPHPAPLLAALAALDRPASLGVMIGDSVNDIRAGKAAALATTAVLYGFSSEQTLRAEQADEYWSAFGVPERV
jgi:phosphoglycolate phosphatase